MSQEKVDKYKKDKLNRKKIIAKQKRQAFLMRLAGVVITCAFIAFVGVSVYYRWFKEDSDATATTYNLSEKEISSVYEAYNSEETTGTETTAADTTGAESETTVAADETTAE